MPRINVHKAEMPVGAAVSPFFLEAERTLEAIRKRAFELFEHRCGAPGDPLSDWLQAERDLFDIPPAELATTPAGYRITVKLPGCNELDTKVLAKSHAIILLVQSPRHFSEGDQAKKCNSAANTTKGLYRRFDLTDEINVARVKAYADKGVLTIQAARGVLSTLPEPVPMPAMATPAVQVCPVAA